MSSPIGYSAVFGRASDGKFHDIGASIPVEATGTLTSDTNNVSDGDTVTLTGPEGTWTYVFRTTITGTTTERQVLIGSTDDLSFANLIAEANQGRNKNPYGTFAAFGANASVFTANAKYIGLLGNSIGTTESGSTISWGAATLTGGANAALKVDATVTATAESTAEATAAAPTYTEGQDAPLSQDLRGNLRTKEVGAANLATSQVATSTTAGTLAIARPTRRSILIRNLDTTISVYVGPATVTTGNGMLLKAGESAPFTWVGLIQVIAASGTPTVAIADEYD